MIIERLELVDYRNYSAATFELTSGTTVVVGDNGQGKTNFAEALAYLATLASFRGVSADALVRVGASNAVVRAELHDDDGRQSLIEVEITPAGRGRVQVNRQRLTRTRDLLGVLRVTVFSPDDLALVKGGPSERRRFLDDALVSLAIKYDAVRLELDRILRQRNTLLRQLGGRLDADGTTTLDVWDSRMTATGEQLGTARAALIERAGPHIVEAYQQLAGTDDAVDARLFGAVALDRTRCGARRGTCRRRATWSVHRRTAPRRTRPPARLACRHAPTPPRASSAPSRSPCAWECTVSSPSAPVRHRCSFSTTCCPSSTPTEPSALLQMLPAGQIVITTAGTIPAAATPDRVIRIANGAIIEP